MPITKQFIAELRGETPAQCTFCHRVCDVDELEPEEAGAWVCHRCLRRWLKNDVDSLTQLLTTLYTDLERAKWWFTALSYLGGRTPHELVMSDQSGVLIERLAMRVRGDA